MQKPFIVIVLLSFVVLAGCSALDLEPEDYHAHADIVVLINGEVFDFNKAQYMSTATNPLSENVHMHDFNPHVVHFHNESATLGDFFRRSEEHTSELQSQFHLVCRLLLEKKRQKTTQPSISSPFFSPTVRD